MRKIISLMFALVAISTAAFTSRVRAEGDYDMGQPKVKEIWVDPAHGSDVNDGSTRALALRTMNLAMAYVQNFTSTGYRLMLTPGVYSADSSQSSFLSYHATAKYPLILQAADGPGTVTLPFISISDCQYFYLIGITIASSNGADAFSAAGCDHVLLRNCTLDGFDAVNIVVAQNTATLSGSNYCYMEDCTLKHSSQLLLSMSGIHYGHVFRTIMDSTAGSGVNITSGSAYLSVERNTITNVVANGILLGGVTQLDVDFATPWLHYDVYDVRVDNNVIANCGAEAFVASGCYDVLIAYNTFYRCGTSAPTLFIAGLGRRTCASSDKSTCSALIAAGAWGTLHSYTTDDDAAWIPNKHLLIYNNLLYNPTGAQTLFGELSVWGPRKALAHATCPKPATADDDIQIKGNYIFNGVLSKPLGLSDTSGCQDTNKSCTAATILLENSINQHEPDLAAAAGGNYHPAVGSSLFSATLYPIPDFTWNDLPGTPAEPQGELSNAITVDREGTARSASGANAPGAFVTANAGVARSTDALFSVSDLSSNPAASTSSVVVTLAKHSFMTIGVYDLLGRCVSSVAARTFDAGSYEIGLPVGSLENGVYFVRVNCGPETLARELVVAR